jgi:hypothetical protein
MPFNTSFTTGDVLTATDLNSIAGSWDTYTPTIGGTGWALGNGTISGRWKKIGRLIVCRISCTWGTTSTFGSGALTFTLPTTNAATGGSQGRAIIQDTGTALYDCQVSIGGSVVTLYVLNSAGTYTTLTTLTSTIPHTWASTDIIDVGFFYESAA